MPAAAAPPPPEDPRGLRGDAPLLDGYLEYLASGARPFILPGHKGRTHLTGRVVSGDVQLYGGIDTLKLEHGRLAEAERRAAALWGADVCRFSVGGSTHANQAFMLATTRPDAEVVVPRTLHRSLLSGLVLTGAVPVWVRPDVDAATGMPLAVAPEAVRSALAAHPGATAVFLGDPSYVGTCGDVAAHAGIAHAGGIPLIVDAAWAAHFGFHPDLPPHALAQGADGLVTSAHKTLPAYSQAALVLARTARIDAARLDAGVEASATTSPAGSVLASIDASRALLARDGKELTGALIALVAAARDRLEEEPGLRVLRGAHVDPAKLVVLLAGTGADGNAVERDLVAAGFALEQADRDVLIPMVTLADDESTVGPFLDTLVASVRRHRGEARAVVPASSWLVDPDTAMTPREAYFADHAVTALRAAIGRVSAELVAPYPPGVPVLAPGERITEHAVEILLAAREAGTRIAYAADPSLDTLRTVA